ncbi:hypothetical protein K435DRAFT_443388 [Dendrothele bispora CBS 962.96]|uniref:Uncharacterized protein n=1 Tax=Dendrothele bispora (strain CBS 962.96) TaxID=1314807 RepID=A0A4S8MEN0_DENBC|nr:hypothetical protein K435DRAFT_443388 [Dendrothele bispora CBS 962.96]
MRKVAPSKRFLDLPETRKLLRGRVSEQHFSACSSEVLEGTLGKWGCSHAVLRCGAPGTGNSGADLCLGPMTGNVIGGRNKLWVDGLKWSGKKDWYVGGKKVSQVKSTPLLSFVTIVPHDKPEESLTMVAKWLEVQSL